MKGTLMGVCPRCGQAFAFTPDEAADAITLACGTYLEGYCGWCDVRALVPEREVFVLEPREREPGEADPLPRRPRDDLP